MELLVGLVLGFILGIIGNMLVIFYQFKGSIAGYRVEYTVAATKEFLANPENPGAIRNKYRYSLGVLIDDIRDIDSNGFKSTTGKWPLIADNTNEIWDRFEKYIRPVINDINAYSFLGGFRQLSLLLRQLNALANLCREFEIVVSALDAGFQNPAVLSMSNEGITPTGNMDDPRVTAVASAYKGLGAAWNHWVECCKVETMK